MSGTHTPAAPVNVRPDSDGDWQKSSVADERSLRAE